SYHMGPGGIEAGRFLPSESAPSSVTVSLAPFERQMKRRMLDCFESQRQTLRYFPLSVECFRIAPRYDFSRPPHEGILFYEKFDWGMTARRFVALAEQAERTLDLVGPVVETK
ncbi:MAG TPA: hypothetical protein VLI90_14595, partial [Tepidisphaeraceae bacterium]|nr:hypothetical protein [Tepidisphaeraceae bacterium]